MVFDNGISPAHGINLLHAVLYRLGRITQSSGTDRGAPRQNSESYALPLNPVRPQQELRYSQEALCPSCRGRHPLSALSEPGVRRSLAALNLNDLQYNHLATLHVTNVAGKMFCYVRLLKGKGQCVRSLPCRNPQLS